MVTKKQWTMSREKAIETVTQALLPFEARLAGFKAHFGILSIRQGRAAVRKHLERNMDPKTKHTDAPIHVLISADIDGVWSRDDGIDQEFTLTVKDILEVSRT